MTTKDASPVVGYNNNVRHLGKLFHIQTEDAGLKYSYIVTHLFADGGRVMKTVKTSYAEYVGSDRMSDIVREMMKQQHKAMFIALRDGKFDGGGESGPVSRRNLDAPPPSLSAPPVSIRQADDAGAVRHRNGDPITEKRQSLLPDPMLDIDALERAASSVSPVFRTASELPPPPAVFFRTNKSEGAKEKAPPPPSASTGPRSVRRYAPTRPASIFAAGHGVVGKAADDPSLDEVILAYLAGTPQPPGK